MPKILIQDRLSANHHIVTALVNAIRSLSEYQCMLWNAEGVSAFDAFSSFEPDIVVSSTCQLNRSLMKNLLARPHIKLALFADNWGPITEEIDHSKYPVGVISSDQLKMMEQLRQNMLNFKTVITQHNESWKDATHGYYSRAGLDVLSLMTCADISQYYPIAPNEAFRDNFCYVGGYWPFKSKYLNEYVLPLTTPKSGLKGKIFGFGWSAPNAVGPASEDTIRNHYASVDFVPAVFEPHAIELYSDIPQRVFQVAACGGFQLSQKAIGLDEVFTKDEIRTFTDKDSYMSNIEFYTCYSSAGYLSKKEHSYRIAGCKRVFSEHTNYHRVAKLFSELGEDTTQINTMIGKNYTWAMGELEKIYGCNSGDDK